MVIQKTQSYKSKTRTRTKQSFFTMPEQNLSENGPDRSPPLSDQKNPDYIEQWQQNPLTWLGSPLKQLRTKTSTLPSYISISTKLHKHIHIMYHKILFKKKKKKKMHIHSPLLLHLHSNQNYTIISTNTLYIIYYKILFIKKKGGYAHPFSLLLHLHNN